MMISTFHNCCSCGTKRPLTSKLRSSVKNVQPLQELELPLWWIQLRLYDKLIYIVGHRQDPQLPR